MTTIEPQPCDNCHAPVLEATVSSSRILLQAAPDKTGKAPVAVREDGTARYLRMGETPGPSEARYALHETRCRGRHGGLERLRKAQAAAAAKARNARGRYRPKREGLRAGGIRLAPRGGHR